MIIQDRDGQLLDYASDDHELYTTSDEYYAAVPSHIIEQEQSIIDRLIQLAFDTLGVRQLTVRVYEETE